MADSFQPPYKFFPIVEETHFVQFAEKGSFVAGKYNNRILDLRQTAALAAGR